MATPGRLGAAVGLGAGLVALGPALLPGYVLSYDLVFVPRPPFTGAVLGTDTSVPRAVPNDAVVAGLARVLPADLVEKLLLLAVFVLGAWGVARLLSTRTGAVVAAVGYVWNPYVHERLVLGHWGFLVGYALLPWVAAAALSARDGRRRPVGRLCLVVALAGLSGSTSLVLGVLTGLAVLAVPSVPAVPLVPGARRGRAVAAGWLLLAGAGSAAAWLVPVLTRTEPIPADPAGVDAFAARADTPLGVLASLLGMGGSWNPATWPAERDELALALLGLAAVLAALLAGAPRLARRWDGAGAGLLAAGAVGLLLAAAGTLPGADALLRWTVLHVPGGGLLRDGQKFVALLGLPLTLSAGLAVERLRAVIGRSAVLLACLPVVLLPSLAWGAGGRLSSVDYPDSWSAAREVVAREGGQSPTVAVFPFRYYRRFAWNDDRVVLDPMPRFLPGRVVVNDDLPLTGRTVAGEDPVAERLRTALRTGGDLAGALRGAGVDLVVVETDQPDPDGSLAGLAGLPVVYRGDGLLVRAVPGAAGSQDDQGGMPWGLLVAALTLLGAALATAAPEHGRAATLGASGAAAQQRAAEPEGERP